jgi:hypothetical protein
MSARPTRRKKKDQEIVSYVIKVRTWEFYFSRLATDPGSNWDTALFSELATVTFVGEIIRPAPSKYQTSKITFSSRADRPPDQARGREPVPIGSVAARDDAIEAYVFISEERLGLLLMAAQSGRVEVCHFASPKLRYGKSIILSVSLNTHFDENDW